MKNKITLAISRGKSHLDIYHKGEKIGEILVSEGNRNNQISIQLASDADITRFKVIRDAARKITQIDEEHFNKEEFNK
jgi:hypothetical protein